MSAPRRQARGRLQEEEGKVLEERQTPQRERRRGRWARGRPIFFPFRDRTAVEVVMAEDQAARVVLDRLDRRMGPVGLKAPWGP